MENCSICLGIFHSINFLYISINCISVSLVLPGAEKEARQNKQTVKECRTFCFGNRSVSTGF
jgi:hypothetical protein